MKQDRKREMRKEKREREVEKGLKSWCQLVPAMITVCLGMDEINYKLKSIKKETKTKENWTLGAR